MKKQKVFVTKVNMNHKYKPFRYKNIYKKQSINNDVINDANKITILIFKFSEITKCLYQYIVISLCILFDF